MSVTVEVRDLRRTFGALEALRGVSFDIPAGQVLGFIGANGSGKTTTLRLMATLDLPTAGQVRIGGFDVVEHPAEARRRLGWVPDSYGAYADLTVREYLDFHARAWGFQGDARRRRVDDLMGFAGLHGLAEREMSGLSRGMAQRLCLGRALLHDPAVMLMDEPAAGLDPRARLEFKRLVRRLAEQGKTLFISSHILSELEDLCDALLFIDKGEIVHHGSAASMKGEVEKETIVDVQVAGELEALRAWARPRPDVQVVGPVAGGLRLRFPSGDPAALAALLRDMVLAGVPIVEVRREGRRIEEAFVDMLERPRA